jgi:hypothetical protein
MDTLELVGLTQKGLANYIKTMDNMSGEVKMFVIEIDGKSLWATDMLVLWVKDKRYRTQATDIKMWPVDASTVDFMEVERFYNHYDGEEYGEDTVTEDYNKGEQDV